VVARAIVDGILQEIQELLRSQTLP
jgi:hypothetical protein